MRIRRLAAASFWTSVVPAKICSFNKAWALGFLCVSQPSRSSQQFKQAACVHASRAMRFWHLAHLFVVAELPWLEDGDGETAMDWGSVTF